MTVIVGTVSVYTGIIGCGNTQQPFAHVIGRGGYTGGRTVRTVRSPLVFAIGGDNTDDIGMPGRVPHRNRRVIITGREKYHAAFTDATIQGRVVNGIIQSGIHIGTPAA